jgi:adenine phosphoribosyltransferase
MSADPTLVRDVLAAVRTIPDFPKPGIQFRDITTVLQDGPLFSRVVRYFCGLATRAGATRVAGIESRGFVFAAPVAANLGIPLVLVRKPKKLPWRTRRMEYSLEYGTDAVEVHEDAAGPGDRVVVIDDLLATGGTMGAACALVRSLGAEVVLAAFMVELPALGGRERLAGVPIDSLVAFEGE